MSAASRGRWCRRPPARSVRSASHYRLLELCRDGEAKKAVRLLREHIEETQKTLRSAQRQALRDAGEARSI